MTHGFRLFTFKVVQGAGGSTPLDLSGDFAGMTVIEHLTDLVDLLKPFGALSRMPPLRRSEGEDWDPITLHQVPDKDLATGDVKARWRGAEVDGKKVTIRFDYGAVGRHKIAMASSGPDADILGKAPAQPYRATFYFPNHGKVGILALESIDRINASKILHNWLARAAIEVRPKRDNTIYKFSFAPVPDYARLKDLINTSEKSVIRLRKHEVTGSGISKSEQLKIQLESKVTADDEAEQLNTWAKGLFDAAQEKFNARSEKKPRRKRARTVATADADVATAETALTISAKAVAVAELEEIVGHSVSGIGFDDGVLILRDERNGTTKIGPSRLDEVFIYPVTNELVPDDVEWERAVETQISGMLTALGIEIDI